jgi:hypothetical protein
MVTRSRRQAARRSQRGATLFVVVLAITMLMGIGLYTVHSTALIARASGSERQALQTEYLAQLGTLTTLSQFSSAPAVYVPYALRGADECRMNLGLETTGFARPACFEQSSSSLILPGGVTIFEADSFSNPGALPADIRGHFLTETTDVAPTLGPIAGMDAASRNAFRLYQAKITTISQLQPAAAGTACVQGLMQVAGQHMTRAHVIVGPIGGT